MGSERDRDATQKELRAALAVLATSAAIAELRGENLPNIIYPKAKRVIDAENKFEKNAC